MHDLATTAPAFVAMAHRIVWASVATVDRSGRPRTRVMHPIWVWDGAALTGWVGTRPTPAKRAHLAAGPHLSCSYWTPAHDTCVAECQARWVTDEATRAMVWDLFRETPEPLGYDPAELGVPGWESPSSAGWAVLRLVPWRLRVAPAPGGAPVGPAPAPGGAPVGPAPAPGGAPVGPAPAPGGAPIGPGGAPVGMGGGGVLTWQHPQIDSVGGPPR